MTSLLRKKPPITVRSQVATNTIESHRDVGLWTASFISFTLAFAFSCHACGRTPDQPTPLDRQAANDQQQDSWNWSESPNAGRIWIQRPGVLPDSSHHLLWRSPEKSPKSSNLASRLSRRKKSDVLEDAGRHLIQGNVSSESLDNFPFDMLSEIPAAPRSIRTKKLSRQSAAVSSHQRSIVKQDQNGHGRLSIEELAQKNQPLDAQIGLPSPPSIARYRRDKQVSRLSQRTDQTRVTVASTTASADRSQTATAAAYETPLIDPFKGPPAPPNRLRRHLAGFTPPSPRLAQAEDDDFLFDDLDNLNDSPLSEEAPLPEPFEETPPSRSDDVIDDLEPISQTQELPDLPTEESFEDLQPLEPQENEVLLELDELESPSDAVEAPPGETDPFEFDADNQDDDAYADCPSIYNKRNCCKESDICLDNWQTLKERDLRQIVVDITPPFGKSEERLNKNVESADDIRERKLSASPVRNWTTQSGQVVTGQFFDYRDGQVIVRTDTGSTQQIATRELSDDDLCFLTSWWDVPSECRLGDVPLEHRSWNPTTFTWVASGLCHKPLYFDEVQLERYGHSAGPVKQPFISAAHFFGSVFLLPYNMGIHPPNECLYTLGYYRPGSCAPWLLQAFPISERAIHWQAKALTGAFLILP